MSLHSDVGVSGSADVDVSPFSKGLIAQACESVAKFWAYGWIGEACKLVVNC